MTRDDSRDDWAQQGKQFVSDLRDTVGKKVADNEDSLRGGLGKAARWIDQKTGGKYADTIGKAETSVGEGIGKVAAQGGTRGATGEPQAPGASVGDPATGPVGPPVNGPVTPAEGVPSPTAQTPPAPLALHRLQAAGTEVRETDTMGTIIVATDGRSAPTITAIRL